MNKKFFIVLVISFINIFSVSAQTYNFFNNLKLKEIDYYTGADLSNYSNIDILNNIEKVKSVVIYNNAENPEESIVYTYSEGNLLSIYHEIRDGRNTIFKYTKDGYLESFDYEERFYPQDNVCILKQRGKIVYRITIIDDKDFKKVVFEKPSEDVDTYYISTILEYYYDNNNLIKYIDYTLYPKGGIYSNCTHEFIYDNELLVNHTIKIDETLRWSYQLSYEGTKLIKIKYINHTAPNNTKIKVFKEFDNHNNWILCEEYKEDKLIKQIKREIKYSE